MNQKNIFSIAFDKAVDDAMADAGLIYRSGCDMMFNSIIVGSQAPHTVVAHTGTPVKTGFARASWWKSVGSVGSHPAPPTPATEGGTVAQGKNLAPLQPFALSDKVYLSNSASYINDLEFGKSKQAPTGMVRITLAEAPKFWDVARWRRENARDAK